MVVSQYSIAPDAGSKDTDNFMLLDRTVYQSGSWLFQYSTWFPVQARALCKCFFWHKVDPIPHYVIRCPGEFVRKCIVRYRSIRTFQLAIEKLP